MSEFVWERLSIEDQRILLDTRWGSLYVEGDFEKPAADRLVNSGLMISDMQGYYQLTEDGRALTPPLTSEQAAVLAAPADASADGVDAFEKAYTSGNYDDMRAAMFALKIELASVKAQLAASESALATAVELLANIERNMPQTEQASLEFPRWAGIAYSAWVAGELIRAYQKQQAAAPTAGAAE